ncbi:(2Fe-2S) ferredoxin domain-containing protein [Mastigocladopsis repens]|uniref:(2Fe-2S) ferredoxin domain-containing protein n=1 Tax=Mastigocladopsis repens TaxID=221287 RepID=UPI0002EC12AF|nr:(2Fe-2S) ferredoxin domain-containing protein [Mastigocladopsis repens]
MGLSEFNLEGQFLGFVGDTPGKFKYFGLALESEDVQVKIPKELRQLLSLSLVPGEQIRVSGIRKLDTHTGEIKLKAFKIIPLGFCHTQKTPLQQQKCPPKAKILVCQKSGCIKRGGKGLLTELQKILCDRGLSDHVIIERTSCLKCCKSAPNFILQIGKKEYRNLRPEAIVSLLEDYLS